MRALSYLLAGVLGYGGLGWLLDRWLATSFLLPIGIVLGAGLGIYLVIRRFAVERGVTTKSSDGTGAETTGKERR
ncbi:hypothetical protein CGZ93_13200 [Enemella dayhoffiae]|uniref:AtpZ/AtpI family protein n=2 Tax=Enemella dayhoffiae TaxID=2016507 RepID=A0A255GUZ5_9ACTN|nr:hypothetical protein CGZ93_13200 [Enemella dayhoffiae]